MPRSPLRKYHALRLRYPGRNAAWYQGLIDERRIVALRARRKGLYRFIAGCAKMGGPGDGRKLKAEPPRRVKRLPEPVWRPLEVRGMSGRQKVLLRKRLQRARKAAAKAAQ